MKGISLRLVTPEDECFLIQVFTKGREDLNYIDEHMRDKLFKQQYSIQQLQLKQCYPNAKLQIVCYKDEAIGRLDVDYGDESWHIIAFALLPEFRNKGIGTYLLSELLKEALDVQKAVGLQVAWCNHLAKKLYERLGFNVIRDRDVYCEMQWHSKQVITLIEDERSV